MEGQEQNALFDEVCRYRHTDPFVPFELIFASGKRYLIDEPLHVAWYGNRIVTMIAGSGILIHRANELVAIRPHEANA